VSAASLVQRYRRAHGDERQQIKWLAAAGVVLVLAFATSVADSTAKWSQLSIIGAIILIPAAIGVAILRLPPLRDRHHHQPRTRLWRAHRDPRRGLRREHRDPEAGIRGSDRR